MRLHTLLMLAVAVAALAAPACAEMVKGQATAVARPTLTVSGTGVVEVDPDTLRVTAAVITEGADVETAREKNAQIGQRALAAIDALKLADVTTKTLNYRVERVTQSVEFRMAADPAALEIPWRVSEIRGSEVRVSYPVLLGYRASNDLTIRVRSKSTDELTKAARLVIDELMVAGANSISSVAYSLEDSTQAARDALTKAVKDAQLTAESVADAAGRKISGIRSIQPSYSYPLDRVVYSQVAIRADEWHGGGATPSAVTVGTLQISARVNVSYELDYNPGDTEFVAAPAEAAVLW